MEDYSVTLHGFGSLFWRMWSYGVRRSARVHIEKKPMCRQNRLDVDVGDIGLFDRYGYGSAEQFAGHFLVYLGLAQYRPALAHRFSFGPSAIPLSRLLFLHQ